MIRKIYNIVLNILAGLLAISITIGMILSVLGFFKGLLFFFTFELNLIQIILLIILSYLIGSKFYKID